MHLCRLMQPEVDEPILVEAKGLYEKMLENITNKIVTNLSDNESSMSSFPPRVSAEQNRDSVQISIKEERTFSEPEDNDIERNSFKVHEVQAEASYRMGSYPHRGQVYPNFEAY
jgi:hypothetical protein